MGLVKETIFNKGSFEMMMPMAITLLRIAKHRDDAIDTGVI